MTREEVITFVQKIVSMYPSRFDSNAKVQNYVNVVAPAYSTVPLDKAVVALQDFIITSNSAFPPEPAQIIGGIAKLEAKIKAEQERPAEALEAWSHVYRAIKNGFYHASEEWEKLTPMEQAAMGSPQAIRDAAQMENSAVNTVVQANFIKSYKSIMERKEKNLLLPNEIQRRISLEEKPVKAIVQHEVQQIIDKSVAMPENVRERFKALGYNF